MANRIITPKQQLDNRRMYLDSQVDRLESKGVPAHEILQLVRSFMGLLEFEEQVGRGEVAPAEVHECDAHCDLNEQGYCPLFED